MTDVGGDHLAWDIIIPKLDFQSQMKISQLNQRLVDLVELNAESELRKFKRHIREDKYMWVEFLSKWRYQNGILALENTQTQENGRFIGLLFGYLKNKIRFK